MQNDPHNRHQNIINSIKKLYEEMSSQGPPTGMGGRPKMSASDLAGVIRGMGQSGQGLPGGVRGSNTEIGTTFVKNGKLVIPIYTAINPKDPATAEVLEMQWNYNDHHPLGDHDGDGIPNMDDPDHPWYNGDHPDNPGGISGDQPTAPQGFPPDPFKYPFGVRPNAPLNPFFPWFFNPYGPDGLDPFGGLAGVRDHPADANGDGRISQGEWNKYLMQLLREGGIDQSIIDLLKFYLEGGELTKGQLLHLMLYLLHHGWRIGKLLKKFFGGEYGMDHLQWLTWLLLSLGIPIKEIKKYFPDQFPPDFPPDFLPGGPYGDDNPLPPYFNPDPLLPPGSKPGGGGPFG
jgi:hypothetical protein